MKRKLVQYTPVITPDLLHKQDPIPHNCAENILVYEPEPSDYDKPYRQFLPTPMCEVCGQRYTIELFIPTDPTHQYGYVLTAVGTQSPKFIPIEEFKELGYLRELNRRFLHPLGMALAISQSTDGKMSLYGIQDFRDDPEGMTFTEDVTHNSTNRVQSDMIDSEIQAKAPGRMKLFGSVVQPYVTVEPD